MKDGMTKGGYKSGTVLCGVFFFKVGGKSQERQGLEM